MKELVIILDELKINLINEINPYGDLSHSQLEEFYSKFGFKKSDVGHMYYGKDVQNIV